MNKKEIHSIEFFVDYQHSSSYISLKIWLKKILSLWLWSLYWSMWSWLHCSPFSVFECALRFVLVFLHLLQFAGLALLVTEVDIQLRLGYG